ncbi:MAG: Flp family type IVb pilin [Frankiaceae bacterium]|nr:Flp family type IVb pilin [Frankiaceae bacterium]
MLQFLVTLQSFVAGRIDRDDKGATAVEYGLMVSLIAVAIVLTVTALGGTLDGIFGNVDTAITPPAP